MSDKGRNWMAHAINEELRARRDNYHRLKDKPCPQCGGVLVAHNLFDLNEDRPYGRMICKSCGWKGGAYPRE